MHRPEEHKHGGLCISVFLKNYKLWKRLEKTKLLLWYNFTYP